MSASYSPEQRTLILAHYRDALEAERATDSEVRSFAERGHRPTHIHKCSWPTDSDALAPGPAQTRQYSPGSSRARKSIQGRHTTTVSLGEPHQY
jgi:hypothetical protein